MLKQISKYIGIVVIAILALYLAYMVILGAKYYLAKWEMARKVETFNNLVLQMFKDDTYGGKTPEETYNLFVDALKNQDVNLAVKYFILDTDRRARYLKEFNDKKQQGELEEYANAFPEWEEFEQVKDQENDWESQAMVEHKTYYSESKTVKLPDGAGGFIEHTFLPGEYVDQSIIFTKNLDIWKISSL